MSRKIERMVAYLPLVGTAIILVAQNFFQGFLSSFRLTLAIATIAISVLLLVTFLEARLSGFSSKIDGLNDLVRQMAEAQPTLLTAANSNFRLLSLADAFAMATNGVTTVRHLRVFAASSSHMQTFVQHSKIHIETCSLLVQRPPKAMRGYSASIDQMIERWKLLTANGHIGNLEVLRYNFQPTEYECIFDSRFLIHGLFDPNASEDSGVTVRDPLVVGSDSLSGAAIITAYTERFDRLFTYCRTAYGANDAQTVFGSAQP
jgi:hypothetical protein